MLSRVSEATDCAFVFIHHSSTKGDKSSSRDKRAGARGSSAIFDGSGSYIDLDGPEGLPPTMSHVREPQEGRKFDPFGVSIEDVPKGGDLKWGLRVQPISEAEQTGKEQLASALCTAAIEAALLRYIAAHPGCTQAELLQGARIDGLKADDKKMRGVICRLEREFRIQIITGSRGKKEHFCETR